VTDIQDRKKMRLENKIKKNFCSRTINPQVVAVFFYLFFIFVPFTLGVTPCRQLSYHAFISPAKPLAVLACYRWGETPTFCCCPREGWTVLFRAHRYKNNTTRSLFRALNLSRRRVDLFR
jgi:hypothetical protein